MIKSYFYLINETYFYLMSLIPPKYSKYFNAPKNLFPFAAFNRNFNYSQSGVHFLSGERRIAIASTVIFTNHIKN